MTSKESDPRGPNIVDLDKVRAELKNKGGIQRILIRQGSDTPKEEAELRGTYGVLTTLICIAWRRIRNTDLHFTSERAVTIADLQFLTYLLQVKDIAKSNTKFIFPSFRKLPHRTMENLGLVDLSNTNWRITFCTEVASGEPAVSISRDAFRGKQSKNEYPVTRLSEIQSPMVLAAIFRSMITDIT